MNGDGARVSGLALLFGLHNTMSARLEATTCGSGAQRALTLAVESTSLSVMDVPAARLTFQVYEPDEPDWVGNETRLAEAGLPPSITERKMSPAGASLQLMAAGWLFVEVHEEG